jgi:predicted dehydrogenase
MFKTDQELRAGLIGFGVMGKNHARVLNSLEGVKFSGIVDSAENLTSKYDEVQFYKSVEELVSKGIDYAVIAVPTALHANVCKILISEGIHFLVEKPISFDSISSHEIVNLAHKYDIKAAVGHIERFNPAVLEAKKRIEEIGEILQVTTSRQGPFPSRISDVGVVMDLATHDIDLTRFLTNSNYVQVSSGLRDVTNRGYQDLFLGLGMLENGVVCSHTVNWMSPYKERRTVITGVEGALVIDTLSADLTLFKNGEIKSEWSQISNLRGVKEGDVIRYAFTKFEPLQRQHEEFRNHILGKESQIVTLDSGYRAVLTAEKFLKTSLNRTEN